MDAEAARTIAAYGGLTLGVINLGLLLYKDYLRKGRLEASVTKALIRTEADGIFDIEIQINIRCTGGSVYLRDLEISHCSPVFIPWKDNSGTRKIYKVIDYQGRDMLDTPYSAFKEEFQKNQDKFYPPSNLKVEDKESRYFSIVDRVVVERGPDGYWEWPISQWVLRIEHSEGEVAIPFSFDRHESDRRLNRYSH